MCLLQCKINARTLAYLEGGVGYVGCTPHPFKKIEKNCLLIGFNVYKLYVYK